MRVYLALCAIRSFHKCCLFKIFDLKYHAKRASNKSPSPPDPHPLPLKLEWPPNKKQAFSFPGHKVSKKHDFTIPGASSLQCCTGNRSCSRSEKSHLWKLYRTLVEYKRRRSSRSVRPRHRRRARRGSARRSGPCSVRRGAARCPHRGSGRAGRPHSARGSRCTAPGS